MARMTVGMRRVMWEVALCGERLPVDQVDERMVRYSVRGEYGGGTQGMERLLSLGKVEKYQADGITMLRFPAGMSPTERERLTACAVEAAVDAAIACRVGYLKAGRAAERRLQAMISQMSPVFAGPLVPEVSYSLADSADAEFRKMIAAHHDLAFIDRCVNLAQVAPEHRAKLAHLYEPAAD